MGETKKTPTQPAPLGGTYNDPENAELLLRAIIDQWERKEDVDGELPSYFVSSVEVEYVEGITADKVKIDWGRSCIAVQAPLIDDETPEARQHRELLYQKNYLPICGGIKEQQAAAFGIMLDDAARERVIGRYLERYKKVKK